MENPMSTTLAESGDSFREGSSGWKPAWESADWRCSISWTTTNCLAAASAHRDHAGLHGLGRCHQLATLPKPPHFKPRAKSVISLFMSGGVSHVDTFHYKPALAKYNGMPLEGNGEIVVRQGYPGPLMKSPFGFKQYGQSGAWVSEIFPNIAAIVDELAFMHSCARHCRTTT